MDTEATMRAIESAVFYNPETATGIPGWQRYGDRMQTRFRPDGTDSGRADKVTLRFRPEGLYLSYNGDSYCSTYIRSLLKKRFGEEWINTIKGLYNIDTAFAEYCEAYYKQRTEGTRKATDERNPDTIPENIIVPTYDTNRQDTLRDYLSGVFGKDAVLRAWELYGVGTNIEAWTIFWLYDKEGRCRGGKRMMYLPDGHRSKGKNGIVACHSDLIKYGKLPKEWKFSSCLFGEHLLKQYPEKVVGVVESEKTAIICSIVYPSSIWIATAGQKINLDRVNSVLRGRKVVLFPDADSIKIWQEKFDSVPGFTVNTITHDYFLKNGENWAKCDLGDILIYDLSSKG